MNVQYPMGLLTRVTDALRRPSVVVPVFLLLCGGSGFAYTNATVEAGRGDVTVYVPDSYTSATAMPLIILLHSAGATGDDIGFKFNYLPLIDTRGFLLAQPNGRPVINGNGGYWAATDACCAYLGDSGPDDDSIYLRNLIDEIRASFHVDSKRIYLGGLSNGGFMAYRMACDHSEIIAAIISISAATFYDPADCTPREPVHVLEIHETGDEYEGGIQNGVPFPGAVQTVKTWAGYDGCTIFPLYVLNAGKLDLIPPSSVLDTDVTRYAAACNMGGSAELWSINGGQHIPQFLPGFNTRSLDFLFSHPKQTIRFDTPSTLSWLAVAAAGSYDVYRGNLNFVDGDADGLPDNGYGNCISQLDPNPADTTFGDPDVPSPGEGFFYLVGYRDSAFHRKGGIGKTSAGQQRPLPPPCP